MISPRVFVLCSLWRGFHVPAFPLCRRRAVAQHRQSRADVRQGAENVFARLRWPTTDGKPVSGLSAARPATMSSRSLSALAMQGVRLRFSVTSGTLFAWRKLPLKTYLLSIVVFCNEVKGKSMLACRGIWGSI